MSKNLDTLRKRQAQIEAQIKDAEARQKDADRKARTSRLVVMGALAEHHMNTNPNSDFSRLMLRLIDEYTYVDAHRRNFDLPLLSKDEKTERAARARSRKIRW